MGGSALKKFGIETSRLNREDFLYVRKLVKQSFQNLRINLIDIPYYTTKNSFGDLDLLTTHHKDLKQIIINLYGGPVYTNGGVYSFAFPLENSKFQVDIISTLEENLDSSLFYFAYNDCGNFMGKIAHRFGLRLGHDGLSYLLRDSNNTYKLGQILVSKDPKKICEFLDLSFEERIDGFETQEEIFDWIISSKYFDSRIFAFENMNHIARTRDRKRESYRNFMEYIAKFKERQYSWPLYKSDHLEAIDNFFPEAHLLKKIEEIKAQYIHHQELAAKFNGRLVMEWDDKLTGVKLGQYLRAYQDSKADWKEFLEKGSPESIKKDFLLWKNMYENVQNQS